MGRSLAAAVIATALVLLLAQAQAQSTVYDVLNTNPSFTTLVTEINKFPDIVTLLSTAPAVTVFAPNNAAFVGVPLPSNATDLENLLKYHVTAALAPAASLSNGQLIPSLFTPASLSGAAQQLQVTINGTTVLINSATVVTADLTGSNGYVHELSAVIAQPQDIVAVAVATPDLSTLVQAVVAAGLVEALQTTPSLPVFAPLNSGFAALDTNVVQYLFTKEGKGDLVSVLTFHVTNAVYYAADVPTIPTQIPTLLAGQTLTVQRNATSGAVTVIGGAVTSTVQVANVLAANGVVHVVDNVLIPPTFSFTLDKLLLGLNNTVLYDALVTAGLLDVFKGPGPFTILAPTNDAFKGIDIPSLPIETLQNILKYHVFSGNVRSSTLEDLVVYPTLYTYPSGEAAVLDAQVNDNGVFFQAGSAQVTTADQVASNGIVHVINKVLGLPTDIVSTAQATPALSTLVTAVVAAGLVDALKSPNLTVFAPLNTAFESAISAATLNYLLKPEGKTDLTSILTYHVVAGVTYGYQVPTVPMVLTTLQGETFIIDRSELGDVISIVANGIDADVVTPNVVATNGVVHLINNVLLPNAFVLNNNKILSGLDANTLLEALNKTGLTDLTTGTSEYTIFAPTDEAFASANVVVSTTDTSTLDKVLKGHITNGTFTGDGELITLDSSQVLVVNAGVVSIKGTKVQAKILSSHVTSNGVVYSIDAVLIAPSSTGLGAGAIAGIVIGSIAAVLLLILAVRYFRKDPEEDAMKEALLNKV